MPLVEYWIDDQSRNVPARGNDREGAATVLLESDDNVIRDSGWDDIGYCVAPFCRAAATWQQMRDGFTAN